MTFGATSLTAYAAGRRSISIAAVEKIVQAVEDRGHSRAQLLRDLDPALRSSPSDHRLDYSDFVSLYERAATLCNDDDFGLHMSERVEPRTFDLLGYLVSNSETVLQSLERLSRYHSIWNDGLTFQLQWHGNDLHLAMLYGDIGEQPCRHDAEMTLATIVVMLRRLTAVSFAAKVVRFRHPAPKRIGEHARLFRCPVVFEASWNELVITRSITELSFPDADPQLGDLLERHARSLVGATSPAVTFADAVRGHASELLPGGRVRIGSVARRLGLSERSLQRRLAAEGTSFENIVDSARRAVAIEHIRKGELQVGAIAFLVGYAEASSFVRAFRRWTGVSPTAARNSRTPL